MHVKFGQWRPDALQTEGPDLATMTNFVPRPGGLDLIPNIVNTTFTGNGSGHVRGAKSGILQNGTQFVVCGTDTNLYLATGTTFTDVTRAAPYTFNTATDKWSFAAYGDAIFATDFADAPQTYTAGPLFVDLSADASRARIMAVVGEFLVLGNIVGRGANAGIGTQQAGLHWSAIGTPSSWPVVATAAASAVQSDVQLFPPSYGRVTAIVPAAEFTLVLQERATWRMDYVGSPNVFAFRQLDAQRGCDIDDMAISVGNRVFFHSRQGFMVCDGSNVQSIGYERVDDYWASTRQIEWARYASIANAPEWRSIVFAMPSSTPPRVTQLLCYNYEIDQWWSFADNLQVVLSLNPYGVSLDDSPYGTMNMDAASPTGLGDVLIDNLVGSYETILGVFRAFPSGQLAVFASTTGTKQGTLQTHFFPFDQDAENRYLVRWIRPRFNGTGTLGARMGFKNTMDGTVSLPGYMVINDAGTVPIRLAGRYGQLELYATGTGISRVEGVDVKLRMSGKR